MARTYRLHDPEHNPPMTLCESCGSVIGNISGRRRFCDRACGELSKHDNCADEPCEDCIADARDDFDRALDWARDHGEAGF